MKSALVVIISAIISLTFISSNSLDTKPSDLVVTEISPERFDSLIWSDEFDGDGIINTAKWHHQTQLPPSGSWYNGEIQHYTNRVDNSYLMDGFLYIVAKKETFEDQGETKSFTSARLNSKLAFTYGRVEVRAKLPEGTGTWPAIWMLSKKIDEKGAYWQKEGHGSANWPDCGEIDIMEHWGKNQNYIQSAVHTTSSHGDKVSNLGGQSAEEVATQFHLYGLEWSEDKLIFSVDGAVHYTYKPSIKNDDTWPFETDQYLLLNLAIQPDISPAFVESAMVVDYIRVYQ